ncbi:MAG: S8 family serine peptidase, partial [Candidatus Hodarchaeota archaeon]
LGAFLELLSSFENVRYIEPSQLLSIYVAPNDPNWSTQWAPQKIQVDLAWNVQMGDPDSVLVAVLDTGIDYTHPDLRAQYVPLGYDWVNNDCDPMDDSDKSHGTHCAGIIAATINNTLGIAGVANVSIMAEKVFDLNGRYTKDYIVAQGIVHAVSMGANIISISGGTRSPSKILADAVKDAAACDVVIIAAAGNSATSGFHYPASYSEVIAVSSTDINDTLWKKSNYGSVIEVAAPGVDIYSTIRVSKGMYGLDSGTSMACPYVVALIRSEFPSWSTKQIRRHLINTVDDLGIKGWDEYYGHGRINAYKAVQPPLTHKLWAYLETPSCLLPGMSSIFNISVYNTGMQVETAVSVELWINNSLVYRRTIPRIINGSLVSMPYHWTAYDKGVYNLTVYVSINENNILDSCVSNEIEVTDRDRVIGLIYSHAQTYLNNLKTYYDSLGYFVDEINSDITEKLLNSHKYVFVGDRGVNWTIDEIRAVERYMARGGVFVAVGNEPKNAILQIAANHGIMFSGSSDGSSGLTDKFTSSHPLLNNVTSIDLDGLSNSLEVANSEFAIIWDDSETNVFGAAVDVLSGHLLVLDADCSEKIENADNEILFSNILIWPRKHTPYDDLAVSLQAPTQSSLSERTTLNVTLVNLGLNNAVDVEIQLWIDNTLADSHIYHSLLRGASETFLYPWKPTEADKFNVTAYVVPISGEPYLGNNRAALFSLVSENYSPTVDLVYPNGNEILNGTVSICWIASDPDGDSLTFDVFYGSGGVWTNVATNLTTNTFRWDTSSVPNGRNYRIRIVVTDGHLISEAQSDSPFTIQNEVNITPGFTYSGLGPSIALFGLAIIILLGRKKR